MNCAFTGHRNFDYYNEIRSLERAVESAIIYDDVDTFYNGMARGFDLAAAQTVIQLKRRYKIKLIACVPFYGQKETLNAFDRKIYEEVLEHCNEIIVLSELVKSSHCHSAVLYFLHIHLLSLFPFNEFAVQYTTCTIHLYQIPLPRINRSPNSFMFQSIQEPYGNDGLEKYIISCQNVQIY